MKRRKIAIADLEPHEYGVLRIDPSTGTLLDRKGEWATGIGDRYLSVFPDIESARLRVWEERNEKPEGEWLICNRDQSVAESVFGERPPVEAQEQIDVPLIEAIRNWVKNLRGARNQPKA